MAKGVVKLWQGLWQRLWQRLWQKLHCRDAAVDNPWQEDPDTLGHLRLVRRDVVISDRGRVPAVSPRDRTDCPRLV